MSLVMLYHSRRFGVVGCDGRISTKRYKPWSRLKPWERPHLVALPERIARKFVILRPSPGLVLAGTGSYSAYCDYAVYETVRQHVDVFPNATFDQIAEIIPRTVREASAALQAPRDSHMNLSLMGFDQIQGRVRLRAFTCTPRSHHETDECEAGATVTGSLKAEAGEAELFGNRLFELIDGEYSPESVQRAMLSLGAEISASRPEVIGPPYSFAIVTQREIALRSA